MDAHSISRRNVIRCTVAAACAAALPLSLSACAEERSYKAGMFIDGAIDDGGWGESCYNALVSASEAHQWEHTYTQHVDKDDWEDAIEDLIDDGCTIIFAPGAQYTEAVDQASAEHEDIKFIVLNGDFERDNVENLVPNNAQIGQLAGALAGLISKTGVIGFIGGTGLEGTKEKVANYEAAARTINANIQVVEDYADSFADEERGYEIATEMVEQKNVDVLFGDASIVDAGARRALYDLGRGMAIAQPNDAGSSYDQVIAGSVLTDNDMMMRNAFRDIESGSFGNKTVTGDASTGGVGIGTLSDVLVEPFIQERYAGIADQIAQGTFIG